MISLAVWTVLLVSQVFFPAWACARAARAVGSPRGRLGVGLLVVLAVLVVNVAALLLFSLVPPRRVTLMLLAGVSVAQLLTLYVLLGVSFRLSAGRTFAPLAGYVGATLACLAIAYLIVRPFVTQAFVMPAAAMAPTLNTGDRFFVNKRLEPRRWDVVAYFTSERDWRTESEEREVYCHRLVGLPGERLRFDGGQLYVNDQLQQAPPVVAGRYTAALAHGAGLYRDGQTIQLRAEEVFVVGDNVDVSADSRARGPTPHTDVVGVVDFRYWPPDRISVLR